MSYKRDDKEFKSQLAEKLDAIRAEGAGRHKPFRKQTDRIVTVTIDENGDVLFLATESTDVFLNHGDVVTKRASHVEPDHLGYRIVFHILRLFGDKNKIAAWTRLWPVLWRVNTKPVGGPILPGRWFDRQAAIDAEIKFLNEWFLERGIKSL